MFSRTSLARILTLATALGVSAACTPLVAPAQGPTTPPTATPASAPTTAAPPTLVVAESVVVDPTATDCPTAWSWAYGPGSPEFDTALSSTLTELGLTARSVASSAFGENNLCNGSFHAMKLDVTVELAVTDASQEGAFAELNALVMNRIKETLPVSGILNIGRVEVRFVAPEGTWRCVTQGGSTDCQAAP